MISSSANFFLNLQTMSILSTITRSAATALALLSLAFSCGRGTDAFDSVSDMSQGGGETANRSEAFSRSAATMEGIEFPAFPEIRKRGANDAEKHGTRLFLNNMGSLAEIFNDSNKFQYAAAERIGITPIHSIGDAFHTRRPLVKISDCEYYHVDSLTHSVPYLVPEAASLLRLIGKNFADSLRSRGAGGYIITATSFLRTPQSVKQLRRVNRNATDSSTHQFGTTFDISYTKFQPTRSGADLHEGDMKNLLAEVLYDLRRQRKCMVKFERKSPCFHITATGL